jgi:hypothetical protein
MFAAKSDVWDYGVDTAIFDALLTHLPMNFVLTLTAQNRTRLSKEFWFTHAPRLPLLEQARLVPTAVEAFGEMLAEDMHPDGPRLPSLTRLILLDVRLTALRTVYLQDLLINRVEQGVPLEALDLRTCVTAGHAIQFLAEIVVDVQEPLDARQMTIEEFINHVGVECWDEVGYDDRRRPWYGDMDDVEGEDEDEDEYDSEHDEFDYDDEEYDASYYL